MFLGHRMNSFSRFNHFYDIKVFKVVLTNRQIFEAEDTYYFYRNYLQKLCSWLGNITHSPCQTESLGTARLRSPDLRNGCPWRLIKRNSFPRLLLIGTTVGLFPSKPWNKCKSLSVWLHCQSSLCKQNALFKWWFNINCKLLVK